MIKRIFLYIYFSPHHHPKKKDYWNGGWYNWWRVGECLRAWFWEHSSRRHWQYGRFEREELVDIKAVMHKLDKHQMCLDTLQQMPGFLFCTFITRKEENKMKVLLHPKEKIDQTLKGCEKANLNLSALHHFWQNFFFWITETVMC